MSRIYSPETEDSADTLERKVEVQAEAAKQAIERYRRSILRPIDRETSVERKRDVEAEVAEYIKLRKRLDELRIQIESA